MSLKKLLSLRKGNSKATSAIKPNRTTVRRMIIESLEDRSMLNSTPIIIDNLSPNFVKSGTWTNYPGGGYENSYDLASPGGTTDTGTWTINVEPGSYRVAMTWHGANPYHASNTPIKVLDGSTNIGTLTVNQEPAPNDFYDSNAWWETLGTFTVGTILKVEISDVAADEHIIADAIRIEKIATTQIVDNLSSSFTKSNGWTSASGAGYGGTYLHSHYSSLGIQDATWSFSVSPGTYRLSVTWNAANIYHATNVPITILDGTTEIGQLTINQEPAPNDFFENKSWWENVGLFTITNSLSLRMTDEADEHVIADAFRAEKIENYVSPVIVDNRSSAVSRAGNWIVMNGSGYDGSYYKSNAPHDGSEVATWTFVVEPGTYRIANTWFGANSSHGSNIPVHVYDGSTLVSNIPWNQQLAPNDFYDAGTWWETVGVFTFRNTLRIQISDNATGIAIADAFRLERVGNGV
ncbi:MAG: hypothetical protein ABL921_29965, partial [Pirellula sp.]